MNTPKIRFEEFTREWYVAQLGELGKTYSGVGFPNKEQGGRSGVPFYKVSDMNNIGNEIIMTNSNNYVTTEQIYNNRWKPIGCPAIFFAKVGAAVLLNRKRLVLAPSLCDNNTMMYCLNPEKWNEYFCLKLFDKVDLASLAQTGSLPSYNGTMVEEVSVSLPRDLAEQNKIADYFKSLDSLIEATGKKIASLKQTKLACLQQMFPAEGETTPRVRFKGFEGEWKRVKLAECLDISNETNKDNVFGEEDVLSVSDEVGVVNQIEYLGRSFAGKSVANYGVLKKGQIVYTKSPLKSKPFGIVKQNLGNAGIVSVLYAIYDAKEGVDAGFIHYYFDPAWRLNAYIRPLVNKGAKNTMNISDETALEGYINLPSTVAEQQQIAAFFSNMDKQIRIQEQRLEKLKQVKSACLDNMFV